MRSVPDISNIVYQQSLSPAVQFSRLPGDKGYLHYAFLVTFTPPVGTGSLPNMGNSRSHIHAHARTRMQTYICAQAHTIGIRKLAVRFHPDPTNHPLKPSAPNRPHFVWRSRGEKEARDVGANAGAVEGRQATLLTLWPPGGECGLARCE